MSAEEEIMRILGQLSLEQQKEIFQEIQKRLHGQEPSEELQAAVRTVFQLFCKEDDVTFTMFGGEEGDSNAWNLTGHRWWLQVTEDMMKSCNIETA